MYETRVRPQVLAQILVVPEKRGRNNGWWDHMGKLLALALETVNDNERMWFMEALADLQMNGGDSAEDLWKNVMQGGVLHVGIIPLLMFKYKVIARWAGV